MSESKIAIDETLEGKLNAFLEAAYSAGLKSTEVQKLVREKYREKYLPKDESPLILSKKEQQFLESAKNYLNKCVDNNLQERFVISPKICTEKGVTTTRQELIWIIALSTFRLLDSEATKKIGNTNIINTSKVYYALLYPQVKVCSILKEFDNSLEYMKKLTSHHKLEDYPIPASWKEISLKNDAIFATILVAMIMFEK